MKENERQREREREREREKIKIDRESKRMREREKKKTLCERVCMGENGSISSMCLCAAFTLTDPKSAKSCLT